MSDYYFRTDQLDHMREVQKQHMQDRCIIQTCTQTANSYGELIETFTDDEIIECGLDMSPGSERRGRDNMVIEWDAVLRLRIDRVPDPKDRIKITERHGEELSTPFIYEIVSPIQRGASGIRIMLRRIET